MLQPATDPGGGPVGTGADGDVLATILAHGRNGNGPRTAVRDLGRSLTYEQLAAEAEAVGRGLLAAGVAPGDRVGLALGNSVDFVVAALGVMCAGAMFVPLAEGDPPARIATVVADCRPSVVIGPVGAVPYEPTAGKDWETSPGPDGSAPPTHAVPTETLGALAEAGATDGGIGPARGERPAYAIYTSGTTGTPKGVVIGTQAFAAAVAATAAALGLDADTRTLCVSPFHFDGSFGTLWPTLCVGGTVALRPRDALLFPRTFLRAVADEKITYTGFSPSYLRLVLSNPRAGELAATPLEVVALGGEACTVAEVNALRALSPRLRVFNRYGPTECTIAVSHVELTPELLAREVIPLGQPHPGVQFHLVDEDGAVLDGPDRLGELVIGGRQLMDGYWGAPVLTREVVRDDIVPGETVYRTGDLVRRDASGDYVYVGRVDRVVKRSGVRISLVEVDDALAALPSVSAARCVPYGDDQLHLAAFVVADETTDPVALRAAARRFIPDSMLPDRFEVVEGLPMTVSGKLDESRLLADAGLTPRQSPQPPAR
jgi:amino acid adenylation domain-containing protein